MWKGHSELWIGLKPPQTRDPDIKKNLTNIDVNKLVFYKQNNLVVEKRTCAHVKKS